MRYMLALLTAFYLPQNNFADSGLIREEGFGSELEAIKAVADLYNPLSIKQDREYIGTVFRNGDLFGFTVGPRGTSGDRVSIRIDRESMQETVALWHTHGGHSSNNRYFSEVDTRTAEQFNLPFYLADYTGYLKVYRPGDATLSPFVARRLGLNYGRGFALGTYVQDRYSRPVRIKTRS